MRELSAGMVVNRPPLCISRDQPGYLDLPEEKLNRLICNDPIEKHYEVEDQPFARGKFAAVRKCTHRTSGEAFAAKFLKKKRRSTELRGEILHEVAVLDACSACPRVVRLHQVFESDSEMILLLELAPGGELQMILDQDEVPEEREVARLMRQIMDGVCYLHSINVAHLDIKPQNLVLTGEYPSCDVKLCDFGISRYISHGADIREILGTPDYVAPEVLNYEPISLATDMWSVGVLIYVLLTGCSPFGGDTKQETFCNISQCKLDFPEDLFEEISMEAQELISRLLVKDPSKRLSATECLQHAWFCNNLPKAVPAKMATSITKVTTCVSEVVRSPTPIIETSQPVPSKKPSSPIASLKFISPAVNAKPVSPILPRTASPVTTKPIPSKLKPKPELSPVLPRKSPVLTKKTVSPVLSRKTASPILPRKTVSPVLAKKSPILEKKSDSPILPRKSPALTRPAISLSKASLSSLSRSTPNLLKQEPLVPMLTLSSPPPLPSTPPPLPSTPPPTLPVRNGIKPDRQNAFRKNMASIVQGLTCDTDNNNVRFTRTLPHRRANNLYATVMHNTVRNDESDTIYKIRRCYVDTDDEHHNHHHHHQLSHRIFLHSSGPSSTGSDSAYEHSSDTSSDTVSEMSLDSSSDRSSIISLDDSLDLAFSKRFYGDHSTWLESPLNIRTYRQQLLQQAKNSSSSNVKSRQLPKECNGSFQRAFSLFSEETNKELQNTGRKWKPATNRSVTTHCTMNSSSKGLRKCSVELMREENGNLVVIREVENGKYSRYHEVKCESLQSRIRKLQVQGSQT